MALLGNGGLALLPSGGAVTPSAVGDALGDWLDADPANPTNLATALGVGDPDLPTSGLVADWDARDLALSDGALVSTWAPRAGSPGSLAASGGDRPTFRLTGSPAGGPCVETDGSTHLLLTSPSGLPTGTAARTLVVIVSGCRLRSAVHHIVHYGNASASEACGILHTATAWATHEWSSSITAESEGSSGRDRAAHVLGWTFDGTTRALWLDGVVIASDVPSPALNTGSGELRLGMRVSGLEGAAGLFQRLSIYNRALTAADWAQVMKHARARGVR